MTDGKIVVQISAPLFWGYRVSFDKRTYDAASDGEVLGTVQYELLAYLNGANLVELANKAEKMTLHLDRLCGVGTGERRRVGDPPVVYACDHRHEHFE